MNGRRHVAREDLDALALPVLRHRILTNYAADAEGYSPDRLIQHVTDSLRTRTSEGADARYETVLGS